MTFWEAMTTALLLRGNAYAEIVPDGAGRARSLNYLHPDRVTPRRETPNGPLVYSVVTNRGTRETVLDAEEMLHVGGPMSEDGLTGLSVISAAREVFGLGLALERYGAVFFANGAAMGGTVTHPSYMTPEARGNFRSYLERQHGGIDRAHRLLLLEGGMKYERLTISPEDAEFIEGRRFSVEEIARLFGVPVHMIGGSRTGLTYSNSETEEVNFLKFCLGPWLARIAGAVNYRLISPMERFRMYAEFLPDALLMTDTAGRYAAYETGLRAGFLTVDEVRQKENLPPKPPTGGAA